MTQTHTAARVMLGAAAWTAYVWGTRLRVLARQDESTSFKVVHYAIAAVSLGFGAALAWSGVGLLRSSDR